MYYSDDEGESMAPCGQCNGGGMLGFVPPVEPTGEEPRPAERRTCRVCGEEWHRGNEDHPYTDAVRP